MRISQKHGVNPSLMCCPVCGKETGVALLGQLKDDAEAPRYISDSEPCEKCRADFEEYKQKGFLIFVIEKENRDWRFFHSLHVIKFEAAEKLFEPEFRKEGACFMSLKDATELNLVPSANQDEQTKTKGTTR